MPTPNALPNPPTTVCPRCGTRLVLVVDPAAGDAALAVYGVLAKLEEVEEWIEHIEPLPSGPASFPYCTRCPCTFAVVGLIDERDDAIRAIGRDPEDDALYEEFSQAVAARLIRLEEVGE